MAEITYPTTIKTDFEKLRAVYSLVEQMRLEHNRQGEIARRDWGEYKDKWYLYALRPKNLGGNIFWSKLLPLLQEQNRLRDKIREAAYTDEQWRALSEGDPDAIEAAFLELYGDRSVEKVKTTKAASPLLDELKAVSLDGLAGKVPPDPTENLTTYVEYHGGDDYFTVTASKNAIFEMPRTADSYLYKDFGADHFGDFEILFEATIIVNDYAAEAGIITIGDILGNLLDYFLGKDGVGVRYRDNGGYARIGVEDYTDYDADYYSLYSEAKHYYTFARNGTTLSNSIYSDAERTNLVDTISVTCLEDTYRYLFFGQGRGVTTGPDLSTLDLENLDLQEGGGVTEKGSSDSGTGSEVKASGNPLATFTKSETGSGVDAKESGNPVAMLTKSDVGSGVETKASGNPAAILTKSEAGNGSDALSSLLAELLGDETGSGLEVKADYPGGEIAGSESGEGSDTASLVVVIAVPGDNGTGVEVSYLDAGLITKFGSDTGVGTETGAAIVALIGSVETGSGVEAARDRALILAESGIGAEFSGLGVDWKSIDVGAGIEASLLVPVFFFSDAGLGSELSKMLKDICGGDEGNGFDALRVLIGTAGAGQDMRLHGRSGQVKMPSKGVNI